MSYRYDIRLRRMLPNNASRQKPRYHPPPALLLHAAIEFLNAPVNFALGNAALLGQRNPIVRCWFLCNRLSTGICRRRRRRRAGNVLKRKNCILVAQRVPWTWCGETRRRCGGPRNKGPGFNNAYFAQRYGTVLNDDARARRNAREIDKRTLPRTFRFGSIKVCALPRAVLSYFWCRGDTKLGARINPIAREEKQVSARMRNRGGCKKVHRARVCPAAGVSTG